MPPKLLFSPLVPPCRCLLCGKKVQHDEARMRSHLKSFHSGVNLRRYNDLRRRK